MERVEAPGTLNGRPSPRFVIQTLQRQTQEKGRVVNSDNPHRQLAVLINNRQVIASFPETVQFEEVESLVTPTSEDLAGK